MEEPRAISFAEYIERGGDYTATLSDAAEELRRQHDELEMTKAAYESACGELRKQETLIAELVEALEMSLNEFNGLPHSLGYDFTHAPKLRSLISKAKEQ